MTDTTPTPPAASNPNTPAASAPPTPPAAEKPRQRTLTVAQPKAPQITYYKVLHGAVGSWEQGTVISSEDLKDIDVGRLLKLGALAVTDAPAEEAPAVDE